MSMIEIMVSIKPAGKTFLAGADFSYTSKSPFVNAKTGDITLPVDAGETTLLFILKMPPIEGHAARAGGGHVSFSLGRYSNGHDALAIWRDKDPEKNHPSSAFSYPALSGGGSSQRHTSVATTNYNLVGGSYRYCLTVGLDLGGGKIIKVDNDPRIKNVV